MIHIDLYRHYIKVTSTTFSKLLFTLYDFNKRLTTYKMSIKRKDYKSKPIITNEVDKQFYVIETESPNVENSTSNIRYNIACFNDLIEYLYSKGINDNELKITDHKYDTYEDVVDIGINKNYTPRDYQKAYIKKLTTWEHNSILVDLQTGMGKTFISMYAISIMKKRFSMIVLPRYIDKWISDITDLTDIKKEEILVLQGSKSIIDMLNTPKDELKKYKASIISLKSLTLFIKSYLNHEFDNLEGIHPDNIFKHLMSEIILNDESHQEYHRVHEAMLFCNSRLTIGLTATLLSNDDDMERMYSLLFPENHRISNIIPYNRYITVYAVRYRFANRKRIKYKTQFGYNQATFEASLMRQSVIRDNYFNMISLFLEKAYVNRREKNDKALIFFGTVDMCSLFIDYISKDEKYKGLKINKYTQEDSYDVINTSDIIVSTIGSSGTALDIPNLITVLQTVSIGSHQANIQTLGRLRKLDKATLFIYFYSGDISTHHKHNRVRYKLFKPRAKTITAVDYRTYL